MNSPFEGQAATVVSQSFIPSDPQLASSPLGLATLAHAFCELSYLARKKLDGAQYARIVREAAEEFAVALSFELSASLSRMQPMVPVDLYWTHLALEACRSQKALDHAVQKRLEKAFRQALAVWSRAQAKPAFERRATPRVDSHQKILAQ